MNLKTYPNNLSNSKLKNEYGLNFSSMPANPAAKLIINIIKVFIYFFYLFLGDMCTNSSLN